MEVDYIAEVKSWIEKFVIGLNLCPFAKVPFSKDSISYTVTPLEDYESFLSALQLELNHLTDNDHATSIMIIPTKSLELSVYLNLFSACEIRLGELGFENDFQLASFHPDYQFADAKPDDQSNYTNRSPYPLIHILRVDDMSKAIEAYGDTSEIYKRNIELLGKMSKEELNSYFN